MANLTPTNRRDWFLARLQDAINEGDAFELSKVLRSGEAVASGTTGATGRPQPIAFVALADETTKPAGEDTRHGKSTCSFVVIISFVVPPDLDSAGLLDTEANRIICELFEPRLRALRGNTHTIDIERSRTESITVTDTYATYHPAFADDANKGTVLIKGVIEYNRHVG